MLFKITAAGRAALLNAQGTGTQDIFIAEIGLTDQAFDPLTASALPGELKRITTFGGEVVDPETIHVNIVDQTTDSYTLRGYCAYLDDGTVFGFCGDANAANFMIQKSASAQVAVSVDVKLNELTTANITFSGGAFTNPPASQTVLGVVRFATPVQAVSGTNASAAMTSADTKAYVDQRIGADAPTTLAKTLLANETEPVMRQTLGIKSAALKDEGHGQGLNADTVDGMHAAEFLAATARGVAGGVAPLDASGKVPSGNLPSIALVDVYVVATQAAQLALSAQRGDVAVRSDQNRSYVHNGGTAGTMADWTELRAPTDAVLSVAGRTGVIDLTTADIGGLATALAAKADLTGATFTGPVAATLFNGTTAPPSSIRYKDAVQGLGPAEAWRLLSMIEWVTWRYRSGRASAGVIAETLADTELDFVVIRDAEGRPDAVDYQPLFAIACAAVQDLHLRLQRLESRAS